MAKKRTWKMWAIVGVHGLYTGTFLTRAEAIRIHRSELGRTWRYCKRKGDRAARVLVTEIPKKKRYVYFASGAN